MIVIDGEFSGLDHKSQGLVSLGAVDLYNPENQFYGECRLEEDMTYVEEALAINGFSVEEIYDKNKPSIAEMITEFDAWLQTCTTPQVLIGHNPKSDIDFLVESYKIAGIDYPLGHRSMDTHTIIMMSHMQLDQEILIEKWKYKINLDQGLKYVGIPNWEPRPHNALTWAKCEAEVVARIILKKKLLPEFDQYDIPEFLK